MEKRLIAVAVGLSCRKQKVSLTAQPYWLMPSRIMSKCVFLKKYRRGGLMQMSLEGPLSLRSRDVCKFVEMLSWNMA